MSIVWNIPETERLLQLFNTAIVQADEQLTTAKELIRQLYDINKGQTITALHSDFDDTLYPAWVRNFNELESFVKVAKAAAEAAQAQDQQNAHH